ncbi:MAG: hypothetical protein ACKV0T_11205 [Planctomycetales bacterium]
MPLGNHMRAMQRRLKGGRGWERLGRGLRLAAAAAGMAASVAWGQGGPRGRHFPLHHNAPPGLAAQWSTAARRSSCGTRQMIRVELPEGGGRVSIYTHPQAGSALLGSPALAIVQVGSVYRLKLDDLPDYPGVELYPTVELLDRLHPPAGREAEFPVPITITEQEIQLALQGRMVTKVIYLEQPDRARVRSGPTTEPTRMAEPHENILAAADDAGRPMAILRLGARTPDPRNPEPGFFGNGAPVIIPAPSASAAEMRP